MPLVNRIADGTFGIQQTGETGEESQTFQGGSSERRRAPVYLDPLTGIPSDSAYVSILSQSAAFGQSGVVEPIWYWLPELIALYDSLIDEGGLVPLVSSWNGRGGAVVPIEGDYTVDLLGDAAITNPQTGEALVFDGFNWVNSSSVGSVTSVHGRTGDVVSAEGDYSLEQMSDVSFGSAQNGDVLEFQNGDWQPIAQSGAVDSVFGRTGAVVATEGDYTLDLMGDVDLTGETDTHVLTRTGGVWVSAPPVAEVASVFGRTGVVVALDDDYSIGQINGFDITGIQPNDIPIWNNANQQFEPGTPPPSGATELDGLTDVTVGGIPVAVSQVLVNDGGGQFINALLKANEVVVSPAGNIAANNVQAAIEELDAEKAIASDPSSVFAEPVTSGVISGGVLTGVSTTQFQITAGSGAIVDSYTDYGNPTVTPVSWGTQTINLLNPTTEQQTYVWVDNTGTVITSNTTPGPTLIRTAVIIGQLFHDPLNVDPPTPFNRYLKIGTTGHLLADFLAFTGTPTEGFGIEANAGTMTVKQFAGTAFFANINEAVDPTNPHILALPEVDPYNFFYGKGNGDLDPVAETTVFDNTQYDPNGLGVLQNVGGGGGGARSTIQYSFTVAPGKRVVLYGQTEYTDLDTAQDAILTDQTNLVIPPELDGAIGPTYAVIMRQGATDLSLDTDARLISFLEGGAGGGGGGGVTLVSTVFGRQGDVVAANADYTLGLLGDAVITAPANTEVLTYNGTNWVNLAPGAAAPIALDDLTDVTIDTAINGNILQHDGVDFKNVPFPPLVTDLNDLTDVVISAAAEGEILRYNGTNWVDVFLAGTDVTYSGTVTAVNVTAAIDALDADIQGLVIPTSLSDLSDVDNGLGGVNRDYLRHDGTNWKNKRPDAIDIVNDPTGYTFLSSTNQQGVNAQVDAKLVDLDASDVTELDDLSDVDAANPLEGRVLQYVSSIWSIQLLAAFWVQYTNTTSGLAATNVQAAIDELDGKVDTNITDIGTNAANITTNALGIAEKVSSDVGLGGTGAGQILNMVKISQADYDNLAPPDPNTLYAIDS